MGQDYFKYLPSEIILDILSRLHVQTIISCRCVCRPWCDLLSTREFIESHHSKSVPGLAVVRQGRQSMQFRIIELVEETNPNRDEYHWNTDFDFDLPFPEPLHSSVNGLVFLCEPLLSMHRDLFLCNPITREYIMLPSPRRHSFDPKVHEHEVYGFGMSKTTSKFKLVRISRKVTTFGYPPYTINSDEFECQVYTVGTGKWRTIASSSPLKYEEGFTICAFLNGNLHFLACYRSSPSSARISCFDLETELFSTFTPPPRHDVYKSRSLCNLRGCLCVCDNSNKEWTRPGYEIDVWLMKEYGDEKWTKDVIVVEMNWNVFGGFLCPIKVFEDGDIVLRLGRSRLLCYSSKTKTIQEIDPLEFVPFTYSFSSTVPYFRTAPYTFSTLTDYAPNFLPLKAFEMENVSSF